MIVLMIIIMIIIIIIIRITNFTPNVHAPITQQEALDFAQQTAGLWITSAYADM